MPPKGWKKKPTKKGRSPVKKTVKPVDEPVVEVVTEDRPDPEKVRFFDVLKQLTALDRKWNGPREDVIDRNRTVIIKGVNGNWATEEQLKEAGLR